MWWDGRGAVPEKYRGKNILKQWQSSPTVHLRNEHIRRDKQLKLSISYVQELINWEMSVYFDNVDLVLQLIEKLVLSSCGVQNVRP